jgi:hypothetical protein
MSQRSVKEVKLKGKGHDKDWKDDKGRGHDKDWEDDKDKGRDREGLII